MRLSWKNGGESRTSESPDSGRGRARGGKVGPGEDRALHRTPGAAGPAAAFVVRAVSQDSRLARRTGGEARGAGPSPDRLDGSASRSARGARAVERSRTHRSAVEGRPRLARESPDGAPPLLSQRAGPP